MEPPQIRPGSSDLAFRVACYNAGLDPDDKLVGDYVAWEWNRARHLFENLFFQVKGKEVLEVGFHVGATAIVLAHLGAKHVEGIDIDPRLSYAADANLQRYGYGCSCHVVLHTRGPSRTSYDVISCISVLEYIEPRELDERLVEFNDLLRPGGYLVVYGSSNRLWPKESHGGGYANYVPRVFDHLLGRELRRGVSPLAIRRAFPDYEDLCVSEGGWRLAELRRRTGGSDQSIAAIRIVNAALTPLGLHAGYITPHVAMVLRKPCRT